MVYMIVSESKSSLDEQLKAVGIKIVQRTGSVLAGTKNDREVSLKDLGNNERYDIGFENHHSIVSLSDDYNLTKKEVYLRVAEWILHQDLKRDAGILAVYIAPHEDWRAA